ncbi:MAG: monovalent cation/H+ antiporter complex subunit F [Defluviitaleaceae bacterium]|nr:monovalent cation/H+ antiporter complex subunit F [Defluviitaleaceae bacterium]
MLNITLYIIIGFFAIYAIRVIKGPAIWDRIMAMNLMSTKIIVFILIFASIFEISFLLDLAILYLLGGFMATIFICQFFVYVSKKEKNKKEKGEKDAATNTNK